MAEKTIEVEVVEIDGVTPPPPARGPEEASQSSSRQASWQDWQQWQGRVRQLDARWWPLWLVLGILAVTLLLTVGVVVGILFLAVRLVLQLLSGFFSLFSGSPGSSSLSHPPR